MSPDARVSQMTIGHLKSRYLNLTETFIYAYLVHAKRFIPHVMTDFAHNLAFFPMSCTYVAEEHEVGALREELGYSFEALFASFWHEANYPSCFEPLIQRYNMPLLHAHFGDAGVHALPLKKQLGLPLVTSFYGVDASKLPKRAQWQAHLKRLFELGDLFLVLGENMKQRLQELGCPNEKLRIQHLGVDLQKIPFQARSWPQKGERIVVLFCGRMVEKKGVLYAIEAFVHLADTWKNLELRIVGTGPLEGIVEQTIHLLNMQDRIVFRGALPHSEVLHEMQNAHLFLLPSVTAENGDMEGTPTVLLEAQASGLPVVSTMHADIPEVVLDGKSGFLAPERNSQSLAEHIHFLLQTPDSWSTFGQAGRRHIDRHYNIRRLVPQLESIYADLIGL